VVVADDDAVPVGAAVAFVPVPAAAGRPVPGSVTADVPGARELAALVGSGAVAAGSGPPGRPVVTAGRTSSRSAA
jgi:hypothetical protein